MDEGFLRISEEENASSEILIRFSDKGTRCHLSARKLKRDSIISPDELRKKLAQKNIMHGLDENALEEICLQLKNGKSVADRLVATSTPPQPGHDGYFDFKVKAFSLTPQYNENDQGTIDYHNTHLFENVTPGQVIGHLRPPLPGKDGITVTGEIIPAEPVKPLSFLTGPGVEKSPDNTYSATRSGRLIFRQNMLSVTEELLVEKNVDFSIGHIDFLGFVQVRGDVLDGFTVHAKKGIRIAGTVGCTHLKSEGDISVGGMSVRENEGSIRCGGNVEAAYLNNVSIVCEGDVHVHKEAVNCTIHCNGFLRVDGRMVGGSCLALGGMEAGQIGTEFGVKTKIICGETFHNFQEVEAMKTQVLSLEKRLDPLQKLAAKTTQNLPQAEWTADILKQVEPILEEMRKLESKVAALRLLILQARETVKNQANFKLNIRKAVFAGTSIHLDEVQAELTEPHLGPCSIVPGPENNLVFEALSPLGKKVTWEAPE